MPWDTRKTGSAAIECAMVAAGLFRVARFSNPNIWDVAGGLALVKAARGVVRQKIGDAWLPMDAFEPTRGPDDKTGIRYWRRSIVIGTPDAVEKMCKAQPKLEPKAETKPEPKIESIVRPAAKP
jgi:myo-inositol-1(or 4)-monophosphatase